MSQINKHAKVPTPTRGDGGVAGVIGGDKKFWKSLDELAESDSYKEFVEREFPESASEMLNPVSRRSFMGLMASSMALAGLTGCNILRRPKEKILAYNNQPESLIPGRPLYFATSMALGEEVTGLVIESHEGRPTKAEGNKLHNASLGATNKFHQASILDLYNPGRAQKVYRQGVESSWESFWSENAGIIKTHKENEGEGLRFLSEYITSPSTAAIRNQLMKKFPRAKWHTYESVNRDNAIMGLQAATGQLVNAHYRLSSAMRILSVDCDFLGQEINAITHTKDWIKKRDPDKGSMSRLYMVESNYSITGARADNRLKLKPSQVRKLLWVVANELFNTHNVALPSNVPDAFKNLCRQSRGLTSDLSNEKWIKSMVKDLIQNGTGSLVCVGKHQGPAVHALAYIINSSLGSIGRTVDYKLSATSDFNELPLNSVGSMRELNFAMERGKVETLIILGCNPVYSAPADISFGNSLKKVKTSIQFVKPRPAKQPQYKTQHHYILSW